jgi:hypothetical protein
VAAGADAAETAAGTGAAAEAGDAASVLVAGKAETLEKPLELLGA